MVSCPNGSVTEKMSWQSLSPVGVLGMAGMRVIPLRDLAPKGLILIDSGPGFLWKQGKNESEERRESRQFSLLSFT